MVSRRNALRLVATVAVALAPGCTDRSPADGATETPSPTGSITPTETSGEPPPSETPTKEPPLKRTPTEEPDGRVSESVNGLVNEPVDDPAFETTVGGSSRIEPDAPHITRESVIHVEEIDADAFRPAVVVDWIYPTSWWEWETEEPITDRQMEFMLSVRGSDSTSSLVMHSAEEDDRCEITLESLNEQDDSDGPYGITEISGDTDWCRISSGWTVVEIDDESCCSKR